MNKKILTLIIISGIIFRYGINFIDYIYNKLILGIDNKLALKGLKLQSQVNDINREEHKKTSYLFAEFPINGGYGGSKQDQIDEALSVLRRNNVLIDYTEDIDDEGEYGD